MKVESLVSTARERLVTIVDEAKLINAAVRLSDCGVDLIVVCNDAGKLVGVVSKTDIVSRISHCAGYACTTTVDSVMTREVESCRPHDSLHSVWDLFKSKGHRNIPILDEQEHPLGMLHAHDILQALLSEVEHEEDLLWKYVAGIGYR